MDKPRTLFYSFQEIFKYYYHEIFLVYFDLLLKRNHANFYSLDYNTKPQHYFKKTAGNYMSCCITPQLLLKKNFTFFLPSIRMSGKSIKCGDEKINKRSFYRNKKLFKMEDVNASKILVSKKEPYGEKLFRYLIGYHDDDAIRPLCIRLPQMIGYVKHFNDGKTFKKTMSFDVTNKKLLKAYIKIWEKINSLLNKEFDSDSVYGDNDKYIKTKIKQYKDKINTNL